MINPSDEGGHRINIVMVWMPSLCLASPEDALKIVYSLAELCEQLTVIEIHLRRMLLQYHCEFLCRFAPKKLFVYPSHVCLASVVGNRHLHIEENVIFEVLYCELPEKVLVTAFCIF